MARKIENCEEGIKSIDYKIALLTEKYISMSINESAYKVTMEKYQLEKDQLFDVLKQSNLTIFDEALETAKSTIEPEIRWSKYRI